MLDPPMDVTMVATRRPDLLSRTLASFQQNLFRHLGIGRLFLNIDPLWGDDVADRAVETVARDYFSDVTIRRPSSPSFGAAVKWLWAQPRTEWCLHLEDDWLLNRQVRPPFFYAPNTFQVRFSYWPRLKRISRPAEFTTSPGFIRSRHAQRVAALMNPTLDPEKQMISDTNPPLRRHLRDLSSRYYGAPFTGPVIRDIGREWRSDRRVEKRLVDGTSVWTSV